ncbi:MAG TPA: carboxypeptidase regulatory-like domain-containing protein [Candidatus Acidoferrum sp.]|jgi:hypothetical protein
MRWKILLVVLLSVCAVAANAQFQASIQGTVMDGKASAVGSAKVTVTDQATGVSHDAVTNDQGFYRINELPPGRYTVTVEATGFKQSVSKDIIVAAEQPRGFDVNLQIGSVNEQVTVTSTSEGLQTENASDITTISSQQVLTLPQFGRDPYELIRLSPGVFGDGSRQGSGISFSLPQQVGPGGSSSEIFQTENQVQIAANGQRVTANTYSLDGVSVNSLSNGGSAVITPNQESVQEIVVTSASYDAGQGRNSGAQVETISKSGTNLYHGSGLIHFNDKGLNAFNRFYGANNVPLTSISCEGGSFTVVAQHCPTRDDQKYRDFAGSFGGPIIRNKLFFFFSYEGLRQSNTTVSRNVTLETPAFEQYVKQVNPNSIAAKIFSTPGIEARITNTISEKDCCSLNLATHPLGTWYQPGTAIGQAIGNGPDGIPDWGVFDLTLPNSSSGNQYNGRVDYTMGQNQFFASTYIVKFHNFSGGNRPIEDVTLAPTNYVGTLGWTRSISPLLVNEARLNFTRFSFDQTQPQGATDYGIPQIRLFDFDAGGLGDLGTLLGIPQTGTNPGNLAENTFGFRDTVNWIHRNHSFKFGAEISREQNNDNEPGFERPNYQFRGLLNFANDACCFFEGVAVNPTGGPLNAQRSFRTAAYSLFVQDDWKLRPNLTVNLGLRWEYFPPIYDNQGLMSNYLGGSQGFIDGSVQSITQLSNPDKNNFGPRIGLAWSPNLWSKKTVLRGGFGVLFDRPFGTIFSNIRQNTPFTAQVSSCCFFDPGMISGPPPGSNIQYAIGTSNQANSFPANPNFAFGVAPDGALCGDPACDTATKVDIFGSLPNEPTPYVYVFSLQTQLEPINNWQVTLGYQGSRSRKLIRTIDLNRFQPGQTFDPCNPVVPGKVCGNADEVENASPDGIPCGPTNSACLAPIVVGNNRFGRVFVPLPDVNASFDAFIAQLTHRFSHGVTFSGIYTLSHSIDTSSFEIGFQQTDPFNQAIDRGDSDFDVRNHLQLSAFWEIPLFRTRHDFVGNVLGGWTLGGIFDKHSGFPFSALIGSCDTNNDRNGDGTCPDLPFAYFGGVLQNPSKQQFENGIFPNPSTEFDVTTKGPGCRCRNIFTGPGYTSLDLSFGKNFGIPENRILGSGGKVEFRANFFNALNILNLEPLAPATAPTDIINTGQFGRPADGLSGRVIEFQLRLSF